jgi:HK97 family phage prohead protease
MKKPDTGDIERRTYGEIRLDPSGDRKLRGYAIVFNKKSVDLGGFREIILPEAVDRTLNEALDVRALVDHDSSKIIGRTRAGTLRLRTDGHGLGVEIFPPNTNAARDILESIDRGDVSGMSFAFRTLTDDWRMEDGEVIREVSDMRVHEVSVVSFPAYPDTDVQVAQRALQDFRASQKGKHSKAWWERWHRTQLAR